MTELQQKYLNKVSQFQSSKWYNIALSNMADKMSEYEVLQLQPLVKQAIEKILEGRLAKLKELNAPECIIALGEKRRLLRLRGKGETTYEAELRRTLVRRKPQ